MESTDVEQIEAAGEPGQFCRAFLREHRDHILGMWEESVRTLPIARRLDRSTLINHVPKLLEQIADFVNQLGRGGMPQPVRNTSEEHACDRLGLGFDLMELVLELGILRTAIMRAWELLADPAQIGELRLLHQAIDSTIAVATERFSKAHERTLQTFDHIASAALESRSLDELLQRLLRILVDTSRSIDMVTILVREGDRLHVRASVGVEQDSAQRAGHRVGDGFVGTIAATGEPLELRGADDDRLHQAVPSPAVKALYGIPLIEAGEVIAVAHIGSLTVEEFSIDDKRVFRAVADRATEAIYQHMLRENAERTSAMLRRRELEFRTLANNIPQLAWMADEHGSNYWYNRRWFDYTGTTLEEMRAFGPERTIHPDHRQRVLEKIRIASSSGDPWEHTFPMRGKDGRYRWFLTRAIPIRNERGTIIQWFGTCTDVTNQRFLDEATKVLNASLNYEETLAQIARLAVPEVADWCVVDLIDQLGKVRRAVIAHDDSTKLEFAREWALRYPEDWDGPMGVPNVLRTGEPEMIAEITDDQLGRLARDDNHSRALRELGLRSCVIAPLVARGRTLGAITWITSESERRYDASDFELARELGRRAGIAIDNARLYAESNRVLCEREEALRSRDEVLAIVSHDLRNPLGAISLSAEALLDDERLGPLASKPLGLIQRSTNRMEHLIDDLLDMATIQAKGLTLHRSTNAADELMREIVEAYRSRAADKGIQLVVQSDPPAALLWCDRDRVEQVFGNLIGNAIKYCRPGDTIFVRGQRVADRVRFSIADTGPGIPPDETPHLFERYWSAKRTGAKKGSGLGLYICKGVIEAHGGALWVETAVDRGAEFFFTLPVAATGPTISESDPRAVRTAETEGTG